MKEDDKIEVRAIRQGGRRVGLHFIISGGLLVALVSVAAWVGATDSRVEANFNEILTNRDYQKDMNIRIFDRLNYIQQDVSEIKGMIRAKEDEAD